MYLLPIFALFFCKPCQDDFQKLHLLIYFYLYLTDDTLKGDQRKLPFIIYQSFALVKKTQKNNIKENANVRNISMYCMFKFFVTIIFEK